MFLLLISVILLWRTTVKNTIIHCDDTFLVLVGGQVGVKGQQNLPGAEHFVYGHANKGKLLFITFLKDGYILL